MEEKFSRAKDVKKLIWKKMKMNEFLSFVIETNISLLKALIDYALMVSQVQSD